MTRPTALVSLFDRLPAAAQQRLRALGQDACDLFGALRDYQYVFDRHTAFLEELGAGGATHEDIGVLLAAVGVHRADGAPLTRGTVSSALSRARERAAAAAQRIGAAVATPVAPDMLHPAAACGSALQPAAAECRDLQGPAGLGRKQPAAASKSGNNKIGTSNVGINKSNCAKTRRAARTSAATGPTAPAGPVADAELTPSTDGPTAARNLRAASILNNIRSHDPCR
jgi:hypothetical protein